MRILPEKEPANLKWIKVQLHTMDLDQLDTVVRKYLSTDWSAVDIIKRNAEYIEGDRKGKRDVVYDGGLDELKLNHKNKIKELTLSCKNEDDGEKYRILIGGGEIKIIQIDESLGDEHIDQANMYLRSQQSFLDRNLGSFVVISSIVIVLIVIVLTGEKMLGSRSTSLSIFLGIVSGIFCSGIFVNLHSYAGCIRIQGSSHFGRNKEYYLNLIFAIIGAAVYGLFSYLFGK